MKNTFNNFVDGIGNTPLIKLNGPSELTGCSIYGKAEFLNPGGSIKDRAAWALIKDAEEKKLISKGGTIVEGTAGNTGIGLCLIGNSRGYKTIIVMPETQTQEKKDILKSIGADLRLVPAKPYKDPNNYVKYSGKLAEDLKKLNDLEGCCGVKLFAGSSTGNLLVKDEKDIEKVISNSSKIVSIHSEDEDILNLRKKFIKKGDVSSHPFWRNEECAMSSTRRVVKIAERYKKKIHVLHVTTKEEVEFLSRYKGNVSFEITPQHLTLSAPHCYKLLGSLAQMNPPIREKKHQDMLWKATRKVWLIPLDQIMLLIV